MYAFGVNLHTKRKKPNEVEAKQAKDEEVKEGDDPPEELPLVEQLKGKKFENIGVWVESNIYFKNFKRIKI